MRQIPTLTSLSATSYLLAWWLLEDPHLQVTDRALRIIVLGGYEMELSCFKISKLCLYWRQPTISSEN